MFLSELLLGLAFFYPELSVAEKVDMIRSVDLVSIAHITNVDVSKVVHFKEFTSDIDKKNEVTKRSGRPSLS